MPAEIKRLAHVRLHKHPFFGLCYFVFTPAIDAPVEDRLRCGFYDEKEDEHYVYHLTRDLIETVSHISPRYQLALPQLSGHYPGEDMYMHVLDALHFLLEALPVTPVVELCFKRAFNFDAEFIFDDEEDRSS